MYSKLFMVWFLGSFRRGSIVFLQNSLGFFDRSGDLVDLNIPRRDQQAASVPHDELVSVFRLFWALALQDYHSNGQRAPGVEIVGEGLCQAVFEANRCALAVHAVNSSKCFDGCKQES